jgi:hypothetical protein
MEDNYGNAINLPVCTPQTPCQTRHLIDDETRRLDALTMARLRCLVDTIQSLKDQIVRTLEDDRNLLARVALTGSDARINAIRVHRAAVGASLKESKDAVEWSAQQLRVRLENVPDASEW